MVALGPVGLLQHSVDIVGVFKGLLDLLCGVGSARWGPRAKACRSQAYILVYIDTSISLVSVAFSVE
jgi:hypothetical protein